MGVYSIILDCLYFIVMQWILKREVAENFSIEVHWGSSLWALVAIQINLSACTPVLSSWCLYSLDDPHIHTLTHAIPIWHLCAQTYPSGETYILKGQGWLLYFLGLNKGGFYLILCSASNGPQRDVAIYKKPFLVIPCNLWNYFMFQFHSSWSIEGRSIRLKNWHVGSWCYCVHLVSIKHK